MILILVFFLGCKSKMAKTNAPSTIKPLKILLLGIDAADWTLIDPMIENGRLPNFAEFKAKGATGILRSAPPLLSPAIWTTIATGKERSEHGISRFVGEVNGKQVPITSNMRRVKAIWNILGENHKTVGIINWWGSYPAEKVNGFMVTNYLRYFYTRSITEKKPLRDLLTEVPNVTYPNDLAGALAQLSDDGLLDATKIDLSAAKKYAGEQVTDPTLGVKFKNGSRVYLRMLEHDEHTRRSAMKLFSETPTDFEAVYYESVDVSCHIYWPFFKTADFTRSDEKRQALGKIIPATYEYMDKVLGDHMDRLEKDRILIVVSDHGYKTTVPDKTHFHQPNGIIGFYGIGVRPGYHISGKETVDVTPTILRIMGIPPARDMKGAADASMFIDRYRKKFGEKTVPSYETGEKVKKLEPVVSPVDETVLETLKSLGYIQ